MTPNNNLSVLPFYSSIEKQNHRKDYAFGTVFCLASPNKKILPFQIIRRTRTNTLKSAFLMTIEGNVVKDIFSEMTSTGLKVSRFESDGYDVISYAGVLPMAIDTLEGRHYLVITDDVDTWYSEVFTITANLADHLSIEYGDFEDLEFGGGRIKYSDGFKFKVYLPTQIGRPEYEFEEQLRKIDGFNFVEKQISEKTFKFNFLAPEYLLDALRMTRMSDTKVIKSKGETYEVESFLMTPTWLPNGYLAKVEVEFQCDTVLKKIGKGIPLVGLGDFNEDFNEDFKKE